MRALDVVLLLVAVSLIAANVWLIATAQSLGLF